MIATDGKETYEYAGFEFEVVRNGDGTFRELRAVPGQHHAAYRERHRMTATAMFREEDKK